ncbi:MAG TPA: hypothetical protein VMI54_31085 [Polyangiaceae bacterium]|nr:hypothetical protein [Polyangiaceae bacterium]
MPRSSPFRRFARLSLFGLAWVALGPPAAAEPDEPDVDAPPPVARGIAPREAGRPSVRLDRLEFPPDVAGGAELERHFRKQLKHAARHADWGARRGQKIEFRVKIEELSVREGDRVVHVRCTALGSLPKGRTTRTFIEFGGDPGDRAKVVRHVLEIVARGVVTRLAAIERERRTGSQG